MLHADEDWPESGHRERLLRTSEATTVLLQWPLKGKAIGMPPVTGTVVKCDDEEQRILIRLGWAVVVHWAGLPEGVRHLLVAQATNTGTRMERETVQLEQAIWSCIRKHEGGK